MTEHSDQSRLRDVLDMLRENTSATISEIAERFNVSEMTIRRDLDKLVKTGEIIRIPGGARIDAWVGRERSFHGRLQSLSPAKKRIGSAAADMIKDGESIVLDSGTTTLYIARKLRDRRDIVIFTFSLAVLEELVDSQSIRIELTGGVYRASSHDLIGRAVGESFANVYADKVIFGAASVSFTRGVMVHDPDAQSEMLRAGKQRVLVVDSSKIGQEATYRLCNIQECDLIITDSAVNKDHLAQLRQMTEVMVVD